jgi:hypothetical protein
LRCPLASAALPPDAEMCRPVATHAAEPQFTLTIVIKKGEDAI